MMRKSLLPSLFKKKNNKGYGYHLPKSLKKYKSYFHEFLPEEKATEANSPEAIHITLKSPLHSCAYMIEGVC